MVGATAACAGAPASTAAPSAAASCGTYTVRDLAEVPEKAWTCLHAGETSSAELVITRHTIEGDPIVNRYLTGADIAGIEVVVDSTADSFGPKDVTTWACTDLNAALELLGCRHV